MGQAEPVRSAWRTTITQFDMLGALRPLEIGLNNNNELFLGTAHLMVIAWDASGEASFTCPICGSRSEWCHPWPFGQCSSCDVYFTQPEGEENMKSRVRELSFISVIAEELGQRTRRRDCGHHQSDVF